MQIGIATQLPTIFPGTSHGIAEDKTKASKLLTASSKESLSSCGLAINVDGQETSLVGRHLGSQMVLLGASFLGRNPKSQGFLGSPGSVGFSGAHFGWPTSTCFDLVQHKRL